MFKCNVHRSYFDNVLCTNSELFFPKIPANDVSHIKDGQKKMDGYKDDRFPADRVPHEMVGQSNLTACQEVQRPLQIISLYFK